MVHSHHLHSLGCPPKLETWAGMELLHSSCNPCQLVWPRWTSQTIFKEWYQTQAIRLAWSSMGHEIHLKLQNHSWIQICFDINARPTWHLEFRLTLGYHRKNRRWSLHSPWSGKATAWPCLLHTSCEGAASAGDWRANSCLGLASLCIEPWEAIAGQCGLGIAMKLGEDLKDLIE